MPMPMPMPKSKGSEMPKQRQSPRVPLHQRSTSSSESNSANRPIRDRSPKLEGRRSPRGPLPEVGVCNQKKRGSRAGELETRLGLAKEELKKLKEQLLATENAKKEAELELEEARKLIPIEKKLSEPEPEQEKDRHEQREGEIRIEESDLPSKEEETSVEEVVFPIETVIEIVEFDSILMEEEKEEDAKEEPPIVVDSDKSEISDRTVKTEEDSAAEVEIKTVKKDLEIYVEKNSVLKKQLEEAKAEAVTAKDKEAELSLKVSSLEGELEVSLSKMGSVEEKLRSTEIAKTELETEMKLLRVQTEQWRKAADAAAAILSGEGGLGVDVNRGTTMADRCVSMEHNFARGRGGSGHEKSSNWHYQMPRVGDAEEGLGNGKRKSGGIRMFGDLWKKRGQHK